jgi:transcriptional regulator with XRE-family HTH domain
MNLNFAENFKQLRKSRCETQERVAEAFGVSSQSVSRWELGVCYPDLELLPLIANYFGVSIDRLLSNDSTSRANNKSEFNQRIDCLSDDNAEKINFVNEYCKLYPDDEYYSFHMVAAITKHVVIKREDSDYYMPLMLKHVEALLNTHYRNVAIQLMSQICAESELKKWLDMAPYSVFSRRQCLVSRAVSFNDNEYAFVQKGLDMLETFAHLLSCPRE